MPDLYTRKVTLFIIFSLSCCDFLNSLPPPQKPTDEKQEDLLDAVQVYHGIIKEDAVEGDEVELDAPLRVKSDHTSKGGIAGDVCGYTIYNNGSELLPFKIVLLDRVSGSAKLVLANGFKLDHELTQEYNFNIAAHDCTTGLHSERKKVHIKVEDVNEFMPEWLQHSYHAEADEGQLFSRLVQLRATDRDGIEGSTKICRYHVTTPGVPFEVDADGYLRNTEPLDYSRRSNYIIEAVAEDCGHRTSDSAVISIEVKSVCRSEWTGIPDRVEFTPLENRKAIIPSARLHLCPDMCNLTRLAVTVTLSTDHIGKGCDRDTYSIQSQRKICGAVDGTVDLLPSPRFSSLTKDLPTDDGQEGDQIFSFDGRSTAIEIPPEKMDPNLGWHFTIATWMKHEEKDDDNNVKTAKEHILCSADGEDMNRHHYSLFVHNCRLIFLLRLEPNSGVDHDAYRPAEWRWSLHQVCDGRWHHYAISMDFPEARLYVDGKLFVASKHNPEVIDDWPLHQSKRIHFTKLSVGACWHGGERRMVQYLHGYLAGLSVLKSRTESEQVIQCVTNCQERLDFAAVDQMETGMSVSMNNEVTNITITGSTLSSVEKLVQRIGYVNTRTYPTTGHRPFTVEARVVCEGEQQVQVDRIKSLIMVLEAEKPIISLDARKTVDTDEQKLIHGEKIFHDIRIRAHTKSDEVESKSSDLRDSAVELEKDRFQLDSCVVRVDPPLALSVESLKYPENLIRKLAMEVDLTEDGLVIAGADKLSHYEDVLGAVVYSNSRPEELNSRTFLLSCTELNGRFVSNQLPVTLEVVHVSHERAVAPQAIEVHKLTVPRSNGGHVGKAVIPGPKKSGSETVTGIVVVSIVCVGFVGLLVILGVMRIRNAQRHNRDGVSVDEKQEMEWDNSALTITVNPMDQETPFEEEGHDTSLHANELDSEEEECSFHDDNEVESEEEEEEDEGEDTAGAAEPIKKTRELEWDDSTLSF